MAPSNLAVGEGAVWVLNTQEETVARIDPETKAVTGRIQTRGHPTDIAAGAGALWVGNGGTANNSGNFTSSVSRLDPATGRITRTVTLSNRTDGSYVVPTLNWGYPDIAVGAGAVWARNPDHTLSRIDPETGRLLATIDVQVDKIAAGREGLWSVEGPNVKRIDPHTDRVAETIRIGSEDTAGIAVGGGSVWVSAEHQGVVWRIEPGPRPESRSIDVGPGVTYLAFGAGAVWAANYVAGTLSRIDPATNAVRKIPIGAAQALAAGAGSAWISTAGGTGTGELPDSACGEVASGTGRPDVLILSDLPLQGAGGAGRRAMADAIRFVLRRDAFRAGKHTVGYRSCDDSTAQPGDMEPRRCAANANAYARAKRLVAVIGPYNSNCASIEIPILNRAPGGPLALISPTNTYTGLTRGGPGLQAGGYRGEPDVYYPSGVRNYFRLRPGDDLQGAAHAVLAKRLGLRGVYVIDDGSGLWKGVVSDPFRRAAGKLGVRVAGSASFDTQAQSYAALADRVASSGAQGVVLGGDPFDGADRVVKALRARLGDRVTIMGGFLFAFAPDVLKRVGPGARGIYATSLDVPLTALPLTATGRAFANDIGAFSSPAQGVLEAGQAAELVMGAIARSDGTRASVLRALRASEVKGGILGSFRFDANGDFTRSDIPILRITGGTPPGAGFPPEFEGATLDRVVKVPPSLVR
jgi:branched-chain amino acid transport system substrate-binding protein